MADDDERTVLDANHAFYRAFAARDLATMDDLWARSREVACIHPGWPPLSGRERVMASWRQVLTNASSPRVQCVAPTAYLLGDVAFVVCFEAVRGARLVATNVFVREEDGAWRIAHHQAGPVAAGASDEDEEPVDPRSLN